MYRDILQAAHQGHPGMVRMKRIPRRTYWWPGMGSAAEEYVRHCGTCQKSTKLYPALRIPKAHIPRAATPASQWALDITGPFFNGQYLVMAVDSTSGFPKGLSTKSTSSNIIIHWLSDLFARYGNPNAVLTDNGPQFISTEFQTFLWGLDIHHYTAAVYNPQENGQVEGFNRYLKFGIQTFSNATSWNQGL